jgi:hypothetical protein
MAASNFVHAGPTWRPTGTANAGGAVAAHQAAHCLGASVDPVLHILADTIDIDSIDEQIETLFSRFPTQSRRPPLFGVPVGVKDIFRVDGALIRCGSLLPPVLFEGPEAECVSILRDAGAIIFARTATTEFAYFEPAATRNPHNPAHTPGGSSSGSAAGVAAGFFPWPWAPRPWAPSCARRPFAVWWA